MITFYSIFADQSASTTHILGSNFSQTSAMMIHHKWNMKVTVDDKQGKDRGGTKSLTLDVTFCIPIHVDLRHHGRDPI